MACKGPPNPHPTPTNWIIHLLQLGKGSSRGWHKIDLRPSPGFNEKGVKWEVYRCPSRPRVPFSSSYYNQSVCTSSADSFLFRVQQMNFSPSREVSKEAAPGHRDSGMRLQWLIAQEPTGWVTLDKAPSKANCLNGYGSRKISLVDWCPRFLVSGWLPAMTLP